MVSSALRSARPAGSSAALDSIPAIRTAVATAGRDAGAEYFGVAGQDAVTYDIGHTATSYLQGIVPVVLAIIGVLLALLLRSLIAPWYLIITLRLSYLAPLGFPMLVLVHLG